MLAKQTGIKEMLKKYAVSRFMTNGVNFNSDCFVMILISFLVYVKLISMLKHKCHKLH